VIPFCTSIPSSTYRIQLHDGFTLQDLGDIVRYLHELGISTVYASPITTAVKGSRHGYDVTDALTLNPDIGTEGQLKDLAATLQGYGMNWLQDIVPNHMAYDPTNPWIYDVLERGRDSVYYGYFDTMKCTADSEPDGRLMAPFLGSDPNECLENGEISLQYTPNGFVIRYADKDYPVAPRLYRWICTVEDGSGARWLKELHTLEKALKTDPMSWKAAKKHWLRELETNAEGQRFIADRVAFINQRRQLLEYLLENQCYVLTNARLAAAQINYRRFFTINSLICLSMEKQEVFQTWHQTIYRWYVNGWINGFRVDHIDGLAAPKTYLQRLRQLFGQSCYVVAEKILTKEERLPDDWQLEGSTGYDFLATASQLLTNSSGSREMEVFYCNEIIKLSDYETIIYEHKLDFLYKYMGGELTHLVDLLIGLYTTPFDRRRLKEAVAVWMASFPVYRAYPDELGGSPSDRNVLVDSLARAKDRQFCLGPELDFLSGLFDYDDSEVGCKRLHFLRRLMQFTGPLAAKGVEDTSFYIYNPYIAHCEVGDSPGVAGITVGEFHSRMRERQMRWRYSLNATTTHDTKRGEDSRIRLSFLSAMPLEWITAVRRWRKLNRLHILPVAGRSVPSRNDEYLIYQSLLGGFPEDSIVTDEFRGRFATWLVKALREAKTETNHDAPDEAYERQCQTFVSALLQPDSVFLADFTSFARDVIRRSAAFRLSQLLLKLTAPGIPDMYQGSELWELSFVDPDNRRPVDYALRARLLRQIKTAEERGVEAVFDLLRRHRDSGIDKLFIVYRVLHCRKQQRLLFADGEYIPVSCEGPLLAYLRRYRNDWALIAVPLLPDPHEAFIPGTMTLPAGVPGHWTDVFSGASIRTISGIPSWPEGLPTWPVILLTGNTGRE
jgi:(1->4)-alpha-D-glucan 1-alpha-D-glucosylmutase